MNLFDLTGKAALVTGGNGGIGLAMARGLAEAGASVAISGRNPDKNATALAELTKTGSKAVAIAGDVSDEDSCRRIVDEAAQALGRLDILINNAGISIRKQPQDLSVAEFRQVLDINLTAAFACSQAAYPHLKKDGGKIINIGSMMSIFGASYGAPYASSKGGVVQLTKSLAAAWAADNVQVNAILPGWIDTALTQTAREQVDGLHQKVLDRTPAGRWGDPADFPGVAVFLASRASDFVTGATIAVDGGYSSLA